VQIPNLFEFRLR